MKQVRIMLWLLVALAALGAGLLLLRPATPAQPTATMVATNFGGPFTLVGGDGQPFASSRLAGKPHAMFFGFTHCPDVCPTTLARLVRLRSALGADGRDLAIVFVTVDPERDGPRQVAQYANAFGAPVIGLTGSVAQIEAVKKQFGIFSEKVRQGDGYTVDHNAAVLLFDRAGTFRSTIAAEEPDRVALDKLRLLAR